MSEDLLTAISGWSNDDPPTWSDERFGQHARRVFAHQYETVEPYRRFCDGRGITPANLAAWTDVPAVPTDVFKTVRLSNAADPVRTFLTSGTTQGRRGAHHFATLDYYREAIFEPFRRFCLPDLAPNRRIPMLALAPSPGEVPESSLSYMLGELLERFGHPMWSGFFLARDDDGDLAFDFDGLVDALEQVRGPVMLLGTAFAFVDFFDAVDLDFALPAGSRVMETGGLKGKSRDVPRPELYQMFADRLGIAPTHRLGEYSMTELSSQAYTDSLAREVRWDEAVFRVPPWVRVIAVDPQALTPLPAGTRGLLRWYDLANRDSVLAVQTADLGVVTDDGGFELHGRAEGAQLRGCSLAIEELSGK